MSKKPLSEKELLKGMTPHTAHADELTTFDPKERGLLVEGSTETSCDVFKVMVIDYHATGEGRHVYIKTGTEESFKEKVNEWLYQGAEVYTVERWLELDRNPHMSNDQNSNLDTLKTFAPVLWDAMKEGVSMLVDVEYHWTE
ncbi:hypothetical protein [Thaumasiovibrio sp. DFM-14]|uniref:hypothetical protein n=1 Tax=Thaumasiovibrio sp. DFM-14 TaxID=3384792 RepID=UPI0039A36294